MDDYRDGELYCTSVAFDLKEVSYSLNVQFRAIAQRLLNLIQPANMLVMHPVMHVHCSGCLHYLILNNKRVNYKKQLRLQDIRSFSILYITVN